LVGGGSGSGDVGGIGEIGGGTCTWKSGASAPRKAAYDGVPHPCVFLQEPALSEAEGVGRDAADREFADPTNTWCMPLWFPPFAKYAKSGAPAVLLVPTVSGHIRRQSNVNN
jgi:hypothetical protein